MKKKNQNVARRENVAIESYQGRKAFVRRVYSYHLLSLSLSLFRLLSEQTTARGPDLAR